jgi:hypothetical protein
MGRNDSAVQRRYKRNPPARSNERSKGQPDNFASKGGQLSVNEAWLAMSSVHFILSMNFVAVEVTRLTSLRTNGYQSEPPDVGCDPRRPKNVSAVITIYPAVSIPDSIAAGLPPQ